MLPVFQQELNTFQYKIDSLKNRRGDAGVKMNPLVKAGVWLSSPDTSGYILDSFSIPFADSSLTIRQAAPELKNLEGIKMKIADQLKTGTYLTFSSREPVKLLVGYFKTQRGAFVTDTVFLKAPELETNAGADDFGQSDSKISNAIAIDGMPPVNIHSYNFPAGKHELKLGKGICLILGFVKGDQVIPVYDAGLMSDRRSLNLDWLFESN